MERMKSLFSLGRRDTVYYLMIIAGSRKQDFWVPCPDVPLLYCMVRGKTFPHSFSRLTYLWNNTVLYIRFYFQNIHHVRVPQYHLAEITDRGGKLTTVYFCRIWFSELLNTCTSSRNQCIVKMPNTLENKATKYVHWTLRYLCRKKWSRQHCC